jgi:hypothetical protein
MYSNVAALECAWGAGAIDECFFDGYLAFRTASSGLTGYSGHLSQR